MGVRDTLNAVSTRLGAARMRLIPDDDEVFEWLDPWQKDFILRDQAASMDYVGIVGAVVRHLRERVRTQGQEIAALEQEITVLKARLRALEQQGRR